MMAELRLALIWAVRDLRGGLQGLRLLFACLLLGVAAISGIGSLSASVLNGLAEKGQSLLGGDVELRLTHRPANPAELRAFAAFGDVSETARLRAMARNPASGDALLGELKAVDSLYPLYGQLVLADGSALQQRLGQTGARAAVVDPMLADRLGLKVGNSFQIGDGSFIVGGLIEDEPDRANEGFSLGPTVMIAMADLQSTALVQEGSMIRYHYRIRMDAGADPQAAIEQLNSDFPNAGWRALDRTNGAPGVRRFVEQIGQFLTLVGLTALMVAGVGVGNGVAAYLGRKTGSIATLKSMGASASLIFKLYLVQIALVTAAAIVLGLLVGAGVPALVSGLLSGLLPVSPKAGFYPAPLLVAAVQGLLIALIFALWPLARARATPAARLFRAQVDGEQGPGRAVLVAIVLAIAAIVALAVLAADHKRIALGFVAAAAGVLALLRGVGWLVERTARNAPRQNGPITRMAISNLHRPGSTTAQVVMALGLGLSLFATLAVIEANMRAEIENTVPDTAPAFFFVDIAPDDVPAFRQTVSQYKGAGRLELVPSLRGAVTAVNGVPTAQVKPDDDAAWVLRGDRGLTYTESLPEGNTLVAGDWWPADYAGPPLISLDEEIARGLGIGIGDTVSLSILGVEMTATIANLRRVDWDSLGFNFVFLFAPGTLEKAPHTFMATLEADAQAERDVYRAVNKAFPTVSAVRMKDVIGEVGRLLNQIGAAVRAMSAVTIFSGILVLIGAIVAGRQAKTYDAVILKLLGGTRGQVLKVLALEYLLLGLATSAVAIILGLGAGWFVTTNILDLAWRWPVGLLVSTVLLGALATLALGLAGTWSVLSARPNAVLRNS